MPVQELDRDRGVDQVPELDQELGQVLARDRVPELAQVLAVGHSPLNWPAMVWNQATIPWDLAQVLAVDPVPGQEAGTVQELGQARDREVELGRGVAAAQAAAQELVRARAQEPVRLGEAVISTKWRLAFWSPTTPRRLGTRSKRNYSPMCRSGYSTSRPMAASNTQSRPGRQARPINTLIGPRTVV